MKLNVGTLVSAYDINIEVDGVLQQNVIGLDTDTGRALIYKRENGKLVIEDGDAVTEEVTFPVDKLHVYLVKPK